SASPLRRVRWPPSARTSAARWRAKESWMTRKSELLVLLVAALPLAGCHHVDAPGGDVVLAGYEDSNYAALDRVLGVDVCVTGRLTIDMGDAYFPLRPARQGDLVTIGASRINTSLPARILERNYMKSERTYRICGVLKDATPFRQCANNYCR